MSVDNENERTRKAIDGMATTIAFLLLVIFGLLIYIVFFTQPIPKQVMWSPDAGGVPSVNSIETAKPAIADTSINLPEEK